MKSTRLCIDCWFYRRFDEDVGTCHKNSPRPETIVDPDEQGHAVVAMWPQVGGDDTCGDHLPRVRQEDEEDDDDEQ